MNIYVSHFGNYDYETELYVPIRESSLAQKHTFFLPHEPQNADIPAKDQLKQTDILIAEVSQPSTGQGIEIGLAAAAGVPILCFYKEGTKPSGSLRFVTDEIIPYATTEQLLNILQARLV